MRLDRRSLLAGAAAAAGISCVPLDQSQPGRLQAKFAILERSLGGRLGVAFHRPDSGASLLYRANDVFPTASTFKTSLVALVLAMEQRGAIDLSEQASWTKDDLRGHSPFTRDHATMQASLLELARAAQTVSDNTATNILLDRVGGPPAMTHFWRSLGDDVSRLDRYETELNVVIGDDPRDSTSPLAMAANLGRLLRKEATSPLDDRRIDLLRSWMVDTRNALTRVRSGIPAEWVGGDKPGNSGTPPGMGYLRGDIGFVVDPSGALATYAAYHQAPVEDPLDAERVDAVFAEIGRTLTSWIIASSSSLSS